LSPYVSAPAMSNSQTQSSNSTSRNAEVEVLLLCARAELDTPRRERLLELLRNGLDYDRLLPMAGSHGLAPLLWWHLSTVAPEAVPPHILGSLKAFFLENTKKMLQWTVTLFDVLDRLEKDDILAIPYKGPALASRIYGNIALRQRGDIDILVDRRDVEGARHTLEMAGFHNAQSISTASGEFMLRKRYSEIFVRETGPAVELHWGFTRKGFAFPLELEDLRPRLKEGTLGGRSLPVFGTEDLLLILCAHGAKHCWDRLEWITGVAEVVRQETVDWQEAVSRAMGLKAEKILFLGLILAHDLLDAPVPASVIGEARSSRDVVRLAALVQDNLLAAKNGTGSTKPQNSLPKDLFKLRLQRSSADRLRYVYHRLTTPRRYDTRLMVPLGRRSIPLPALVRPFRIVGKLIGYLFR
jgi:hypothetical protein